MTIFRRTYTCYLRFLVTLALTLTVAHGDICTKSRCFYTFDVRRARTMTYTTTDANNKSSTYNVVLNGSSLVVTTNTMHLADDPFIGRIVPVEDTMTADGFLRTIIVINGLFPGPTIEVMEGAQVI